MITVLYIIKISKDTVKVKNQHNNIQKIGNLKRKQQQGSTANVISII